jgi:hypothetical protein
LHVAAACSLACFDRHLCVSTSTEVSGYHCCACLELTLTLHHEIASQDGGVTVEGEERGRGDERRVKKPELELEPDSDPDPDLDFDPNPDPRPGHLVRQLLFILAKVHCRSCRAQDVHSLSRVCGTFGLCRTQHKLPVPTSRSPDSLLPTTFPPTTTTTIITIQAPAKQHRIPNARVEVGNWSSRLLQTADKHPGTSLQFQSARHSPTTPPTPSTPLSTYHNYKCTTTRIHERSLSPTESSDPWSASSSSMSRESRPWSTNTVHVPATGGRVVDHRRR